MGSKPSKAQRAISVEPLREETVVVEPEKKTLVFFLNIIILLSLSNKI